MRDLGGGMRRLFVGATCAFVVLTAALPAHAGGPKQVVATADTYTVEQGQSVVVNFLDNDSFGSFDGLVVVDRGTPQQGVFSGALEAPSYTPNAGFAGDETIAYTVCGARGGVTEDDCDTATI